MIDYKTCPACKGAGVTPWEDELNDCEVCKGTGQLPKKEEKEVETFKKQADDKIVGFTSGFGTPTITLWIDDKKVIDNATLGPGSVLYTGDQDWKLTIHEGQVETIPPMLLGIQNKQEATADMDNGQPDETN